MGFHKSSGLKNESAYGSDRARAQKTRETIFHDFMHLSILAQIQPPQKYPSVTRSGKVINWYRKKTSWTETVTINKRSHGNPGRRYCP